ncbi:uncharacterized protein LOC133825028 [Humulus lupulus]|uniref:uncharacterized protein LOC133825028 n=1 Tax=Humulus lupulus TaxID=3486 RepID=UPI002B407218|nr:uncharacterized protein LOC133825028 [Humulus lupulus]
MTIATTLISSNLPVLSDTVFPGITTLSNCWYDSIITLKYYRCVDVTGAYSAQSAQKTELNISLTTIGLLWTTTDFIAKGITHGPVEERETNGHSVSEQMDGQKPKEKSLNVLDQASFVKHDKLLFSVFSFKFCCS